MEWLTHAIGNLPEGFVYWYQWFMVTLFVLLQSHFRVKVFVEKSFIQRVTLELQRIRVDVLSPDERIYEFDRWLLTQHNKQNFLAKKVLKDKVSA